MVDLEQLRRLEKAGYPVVIGRRDTNEKEMMEWLLAREYFFSFSKDMLAFSHGYYGEQHLITHPNITECLVRAVEEVQQKPTD